jgi:dTDP-4-dehydrorhamnose 3,5-epimerase
MLVSWGRIVEPRLIEGGLSIDDRGVVSYANDFDFKGVKRFYMVQNHSKGFIRAWHGHKKEAKYVYVVSGSIKLGIVAYFDDTPKVYILSANKPQVLYIPRGHYNGFQTLTDDAKVIFYSTSTLEESKGDDDRVFYKHWDIWSEDYR